MERDLMPELVEEILLRLPADDPGGLVRAAAVCRRWCRIIVGPGFLRRFVARQREPRLLGFLANIRRGHSSVARFVPVPIPRPPLLRRCDRDGCRALDARHGLVLLAPSHWAADFKVWDPLTGEGWVLPPMPLQPELDIPYSWNAAVLCAAHGLCDHKESHGGRFLVVVLDTDGENMRVHTYSGETDSWSAGTFGPPSPPMGVEPVPAALVRNFLFFLIDARRTVVGYDLTTGGMSTIPLPTDFHTSACALTRMEQSTLGLARIHHNCIHFWVTEIGAEGDASAWKQLVSVEPPLDPLCTGEQYLGLAGGFRVLFVGSLNGRSTFIICGESGDKVIEQVVDDHRTESVVPYLRFLSDSGLFSKTLKRICKEAPIISMD